MGVPFLGEVPLHMEIRRHSDSGTPIVVSDPSSPHAEIYNHIAGGAIERLAVESGGRAASAPKIVIE